MENERRNDNLDQILESCIRECAEENRFADDAGNQAMERSCAIILRTYHRLKLEGRLSDLEVTLRVPNALRGNPAASLRRIALKALGDSKRQLAHKYGDALALADESGVGPENIVEFIRERTLTGAAREYAEKHRQVRRQLIQIINLKMVNGELLELASCFAQNKQKGVRKAMLVVDASFDVGARIITINRIFAPNNVKTEGKVARSGKQQLGDLDGKAPNLTSAKVKKKEKAKAKAKAKAKDKVSQRKAEKAKERKRRLRAQRLRGGR